MRSLLSYFSYNKRQRNGVFFLLIIIVILQVGFFCIDFSSKEINKISQNELQSFQKELDSLRFIEEEKSKFKVYPFNPNYISDFKGYQLGMSVEEIDKLLNFRANGKYVNSAKQFQNITGVSDSLLNAISPYFKFPSWVSSKRNFATNSVKNEIEKEFIIQNINTATKSELQSIRGIGEKLANRIIGYRDKLQGFSFNNQLYEVWYLDKEVADKVLKKFQVTVPPKIKKININEAEFKEVLAIVYMDYELTKKVFSYRDEVAEIQSIEELKKIDGFPIEKFDRIVLYLVAE